jgi:hypothetical protein
VANGQAPEYPFSNLGEPPDGYTWNEISYVVGGYHWKARFLDQQGYIISGPPGASNDSSYLNQWNLANETVGKDAGWAGYKAGSPQLPYDWGFILQINRDSGGCTQCHQRGTDPAIGDGFIQHHEGYGDLPQGKHAIIDCVICHDPHKLVVQSLEAGEATTHTRCENCHYQEAQVQNNPKHVAMKLACVECHMPSLIQSAWGDATTYTGDFRTHRMAIDPNQIGQFSEDGTTALPQIGLDYACRHCHIQGKGFPRTDDELKAGANGYHSLLSAP